MSCPFFVCKAFFARCLINLFGRQQSGKRKKREVKGISFTKKMVISLVGGLIVGLGFFYFFKRAPYSQTIKALCGRQSIRFFFQDISDPEKGQSAIGLFYIIGQLFINGLQLVIVPMVFTSITLAICHITDTQKN